MAQNQQQQSLQKKKKDAEKAKKKKEKELLKLLGTGSARSAGEAIRRRNEFLKNL